MKKTIYILILLSIFQGAYAFCQAPHLAGKITVSLKSGTIEADLTLKNLPKTDNYSIWLNTGLNIEYFRNLEDRFNFSYNTEYNPELSSEALQHYFQRSG